MSAVVVVRTAPKHATRATLAVILRLGALIPLLGMTSALGCVSLSGLSEGSPDGGADTGHGHSSDARVADGPVDTTRPGDGPHDASHPADAAHDTSHPEDATHDGSHPVDAPHDTSHPEDATHDGSHPVDAPHDASHPTDAPHDASHPVDSSACPGGIAVLATSGAVSTATGLAMQTHVIYAVNTHTWWLFTIDSADPALLKTRYSTDFCNWSDGAALTLPYPHANEGRNFSVAYSDIAGDDVVHISFSHYVSATARYHTHTRAVISGTTITYDTPALVCSYLESTSYLIDPDGPATGVGTDGVVTDLTGWIDEGGGHIDDALAWRSVQADNGSTWSNTWGTYSLLTYVPYVVNARAITPLLGGSMLTFWDDASAEPNPDNVQWALWSGTAWSSVAYVFPDETAQGVNDWSILQMLPTDVHAVRRTLANTFEHERFNGSTWSAGGAIPSDDGEQNTGVVLASTGTSTLALYAIASGSSTIRTIAWNGSAWGTWSSAVTSAGTRTSLSAYASPAAGKAAILWTETSGANYEVSGMLVAQ